MEIKTMVKTKKLSKDRSTHVTDEVFNASSHMASALFSLFGTALLIVASARAGKVWHIVSFAIYGTTLFCVFFFSTLHHGVNSKPKIEALLRKFDYLAIFPLIAGTYTPLCLVLLRETYLGWTLFGVVWAAAILGIALRSAYKRLPHWPLNTLYLAMGWLGAIIAFPVYEILSVGGLSLFVGGGIFYTVGFVIFNKERPNPLPGKFGFHEIWHIFVMLGALCHYLLMYVKILPLD